MSIKVAPSEHKSTNEWISFFDIGTPFFVLRVEKDRERKQII